MKEVSRNEAQAPMTEQHHPFVDDIDAGYENVAVLCPRCRTRNTYNRATDIGHLDPIDNHRVACLNPECLAEFDIGGDLVNAPHEMLLLDSCNFIREKRYMQAVLSATTAYELFFAHFLRVQLLFRPSRRDRDGSLDEIVWLNHASALLRNKTLPHAFGPMRQMFLRAAVDDIQPATMAIAEAYIAGIPPYPPAVARCDIEQLSDAPRRDLLLRVHDASIAKLRNNIVHKTAYRPTLTETKSAVDDAYKTVFRLSSHFGLATDSYHLNEPLD